MSENFLDLLSTGFLISREMVENHGEDSFYFKYSDYSAVLCVLDGCGGLGSQTYEGCGNHTGAYLASRTVGGAIHDWYHDVYNRKWKSDREFMESMLAYIKKGYETVRGYAKSSLRISGSMVRDLPTTMALAYACMKEGNLAVHVVWAGDSRIYLMDEEGMCQLTRDDVKSQDALSNLSDDGALTNVLSSDGNYRLHHKLVILKKPSLIIGATDGCFGYLPTPMDFEYGILRALEESKSISQLKASLKSFFGEAAGDDFTFACMGFGYDSYSDLKKSCQGRRKFMEKEYMDKLRKEPENEELIQSLWKKYSVSYERYLTKSHRERE